MIYGLWGTFVVVVMVAENVAYYIEIEKLYALGISK